jgi:hypothetical protein
MTVRETLDQVTDPREDALRNELIAELENPKTAGEPDIVIEGGKSSGVKLLVIWSRWEGIDQTVRSRLILDAYEKARGEPAALRVVVSMGLTPEESRRLGIG